MAKLHYRDTPTDKDKKAFEQFLSDDEELILVTGYGATYLRSLFIMALLWPGVLGWAIGIGVGYYYLNISLLYSLIGGFILSIVIAFLRASHIHHANRYLLTTRRVVIKKGIFAVKLASALYDKITHLEVDQSFLDKLLMHHGTIVVHTAGSQNDEMVLRYVDYPIEFKNLLERLINRQREHFGVRGGVEVVEGELMN
jgi:membrane protein YdbS with pleckstrin-like domain